MKTPEEILPALHSSRPQTRQGQAPYTPHHLLLVTTLWERMIQLFGNKWVKTEGNIFKVDKNGNMTDVYEDRFLIWCSKTRQLFRCHSESDPNETAKRRFAKGMEFVENEVMESARMGERRDVWPPSYAKFLGFCQIGAEEASHKVFKPLALESDEAKEKARTAAERELDKMKSLFE